MDRLNATDLHTVLDVARELSAVQDVDGLRARVLPQLRRLVPCDLASFNEIAPRTGEAIVAAVDPAGSMFAGGEEIFGAYAHQNPLIAAAQRPGHTGVHKFSDFISRQRLHRLEIYDLLYSQIEVEHQIAFTLPAPSTHVVGFALSRRRRDFSERDRGVLAAVRPFVVQAYEHANVRARASATVAALERATDAGSHAVIVLGGDGRIEFATGLAVRWIAGLPHTAVSAARLPEPLESWSVAQRTRAREKSTTAGRLELDAGGATITAHFIAGGLDRGDTILLERRAPIEVATLRLFGLTAREVEVLELLAHGLSNGQIASELALSERTVAKHLEHVYEKLEVGNRTAAVARAREAAARPDAGPAADGARRTAGL
jgi:DNA-binding CsgD family transcriptional regulator